MKSHDSQFNSSIKSDIVYSLIFLLVLSLCIGTWESSVLITDNYATWSDILFISEVAVYLSS